MRLATTHLPKGMDHAQIDRAVVVSGGLSGVLGETALVVYGGRLAVLTRESSIDTWLPMKLSSRPRLEDTWFGSALQLQPSDGDALSISVMAFDTEEVLAVLNPRAAKTGAAAPRPAATTPKARKPPKPSPAAAREAPPEARESGVSFRELEVRALKALKNGRFDLARQSFERLAEVAVPEAKMFESLADCTEHLAQGETEAAFFVLRAEVDRMTAPAYVLSKLTGIHLVRQGKVALAAAAFAAAATAAVSGSDELAERAADLREESGMDERSLEVAIIDATIEHYKIKLQGQPGSDRVLDSLRRLEALRSAGKRATAAAWRTADKLAEPIRGGLEELGWETGDGETSGTGAHGADARSAEASEDRIRWARTLAKAAFYTIAAILLIRTCT